MVTTKMQKLWKVDTSNWAVREVEGEAWPYNDSEGDRIYENTHYADADAAWTCLMRNAEAAMRLSAEDVERVRRDLHDTEQRAAKSVVDYAKVKAGFEARHGKARIAGDGSSVDGAAAGTRDELYGRAVDYVRVTGKTSISSLQIALRTGYNRTARMLEDMERDGVVSIPDRRGVRQLLLGVQ